MSWSAVTASEARVPDPGPENRFRRVTHLQVAAVLGCGVDLQDTRG
jgi:hypothetical protein